MLVETFGELISLILINHHYNENYTNPDIFRVNSWSDIYKLIVEGEHYEST